MVETGQYRVEGIELVKISMGADRWAGTAVAGTFPVIEPLHRSRGHATLRRAFRQTPGIRWYVLNDPVHPRHLRCTRIRCVGVVDDERESLRALRGHRPIQRR